MRIGDLFSQINRLISKDKEQVKAAPIPREQNKAGDTLEISSKVKEVKDLVAITLQTPAHNVEKIAVIKERIALGAYQKDSKQLAEKMLTKD